MPWCWLLPVTGGFGPSASRPKRIDKRRLRVRRHQRHGRPRHAWFSLGLSCASGITGCLVSGLLAPPSAQAVDVVLGSPTYVLHGSGFGTARPSTFFNGGAPSGLVRRIHWRHWGAATATGTGFTPLYKPQGGYFPKSGRISLRAKSIGHCAGQTRSAYTLLLFRIPPWPGGPLGPWLKWSGSRTICDYADTDPRYKYPKSPPGECGQIGKDYRPGDLFDIRAYRVSCKRGRQVAVRSRRSYRTCSQTKCVTRKSGFRCQWQAARSGETSPSLDASYPAQRVSCRRGQSTLTWWRVEPAE